MLTFSHVKLKSTLLLEAQTRFGHNSRITNALNGVFTESEAYAADELVVLAEEVLQQIAAVGFVHYLQCAPQKEVYNDFLVQLFTSSGHDHNAGPLFRWAANMVLECPEMQASGRFGFFWQTNMGQLRLAERVHHLSELRNQVMHGFFVLPPERSREEADRIGQLLLELHAVNFFDVVADYHFCKNGQFTGRWSIQSEFEWRNFFHNGVFGELAGRIVDEQGASFWEREAALLLAEGGELPEKNRADLLDFLANNNRGAMALWVHPEDERAAGYFAAVGTELSRLSNARLIAYGLHEQGLSYTGSFLLNRILHVLNSEGTLGGKNKKLTDLIATARKQTEDRVIVLIDHIHLALFSPQHVSRLSNLLYENNVLLVAIGHHYEHLNGCFNAQSLLAHVSIAPDAARALAALHNFLRFKGPSYERSEEREDVRVLEQILAHVLQELSDGKVLYARRFADEHRYDLEYVHEIFAVLHPWVKASRAPFEADIVDETFGFPRVMTEVTPIYLALGRRDVKLEYQHKVISL